MTLDIKRKNGELLMLGDIKDASFDSKNRRLYILTNDKFDEIIENVASVFVNNVKAKETFMCY